ncbi:MAG: TetR/AcrR family transcriptional regulator [Gordonibacter sp.]|uniref:TetR/AcrR family transcriptional regulator n=1 Tax=Gordonibacter sp. TaxID=1968902 RepID=UPI002FCA2DAA
MAGIDIICLSADEQMKLKIVHSIASNIYDVSIDDICSSARISRRTFYNNFQSKYAIPLWHKNFICKYTLDKIGQDYSWEEGYERFFSMCLKEKKYLLHTAQHHYDSLPVSFDSALETSTWYKNRAQQLGRALERQGIDPSEKQMRYCIEMCTRIESFAARSWIGSESPDAPRVIAACLVACVPRALYDALQKKEPQESVMNGALVEAAEGV